LLLRTFFNGPLKLVVPLNHTTLVGSFSFGSLFKKMTKEEEEEERI
jgi:hypothetical protein